MQVKLKFVKSADGLAIEKVVPADALQASVDPTDQEMDGLFDRLVEMANFAHHKGRQDVSDKLEEALDILLEPAVEAKKTVQFCSTRKVEPETETGDIAIFRHTAKNRWPLARRTKRRRVRVPTTKFSAS